MPVRFLRTSFVTAACLYSLTSATIAAQTADPERAQLARWSGELDESLRQAGQVLRESRTMSSTGDGSALVRRLAALASRNADALMEILVRGRVPEAAAGDAPQILSAPQRILLLAAMARLPAAELRGILAKRLEQDPKECTRIAAVHVLGVIGGGGDMAKACDLVSPGRDDRPTRPASDALRVALTAILKRDGRSWDSLSSLIASQPFAIQQVMLSAIADAEDPRAFAVLFNAARTSTQLEQQAVSLLRSAARGAGAEERRECTDWLVSQLVGARPDYLRSLIQTMGHMDDGGRIQELFGYLADENPNIRDAAGWALRKITGASYPTDARLWATWYAEERRWMDRERPRLRDRLGSFNRADVVSALRRYAERKTFRDELVIDLLPLLSRPEEDLVVLSCEVIARLGSSEAVHDLTGLLDDSRPRIVAAATTALQTITGHVPECPSEQATAMLADR